jgi:histidinol dehydrogenase
VLEYTRRFDRTPAPPAWAALELSGRRICRRPLTAWPAPSGRWQTAARRVRSYHEAQKKASGESWSYRDEDGSLLGQKVTPLDRVGIYVPGGKAAYPSS